MPGRMLVDLRGTDAEAEMRPPSRQMRNVDVEIVDAVHRSNQATAMAGDAVDRLRVVVAKARLDFEAQVIAECIAKKLSNPDVARLVSSVAVGGAAAKPVHMLEVWPAGKAGLRPARLRPNARR
jgi:hypothetical protein